MTTRTVSTELTPAQRQAFEEAVERYGKSFFANADLIWKTLVAAGDCLAGKATPQMIEDGVVAYNMVGISNDLIPTAEAHVEFIWNAMVAASPKPTDTDEKEEAGDGSPSDS